MQANVNGKILQLVQGDITRQEVDAIVNAANSGLRGGGGVDGAIHRAGGPEIMRQCRRLGGCPTGSACVTTAGRLRARFVIHAVGPVWHGGSSDEATLLGSAYRRSLEVADEKGITSIAFPSLSTGAYRYPPPAAAPIATSTVVDFIKGKTSINKVVFVLFNDSTYEAFCQALEQHLRQEDG